MFSSNDVPGQNGMGTSMAYSQQLGSSVRGIRESMGLSVVDFAARVSCQPKLIEIIEKNGLLHQNNALSVLARIAELAGPSADVLLFQDTLLVDVVANRQKLKAFEIIHKDQMTESLEVLNDVFEQNDFECQAALADQSRPVLAF